MPSPELLAPDRAERLLAGGSPETAREADVERLVRELRAVAAPAPAALRERVRAVSAAPPRHGRRRRLAFAVPVLVALAAVLGVLALDERPADRTSSLDTRLSEGPDSVSGGAEPWRRVGDEAVAGSADYDAEGGVVLAEKDRRASEPLASPLSSPTGRAQDVDLFVSLRLRDAEELSEAASAAMRATADLGGVVTGSRVDTGGREGTARLQLRIPTRRLEDAILRLSALGEITEQRVATRDLQGGIDRRSNRIETLETAIQADELRLASGTLSASEKLEVELRLVRERAQLRALRRERATLARQAAFAELTLTLHTREAATAGTKENGIGGAARDAVDALGRAGEIAVFAGILLAPLAALAVVSWIALRGRRRRVDERVLEQPRPAAPSQPS